ncbi:MAG: CxxC-x17-CxxC domain-containing protein [Cyanobacteriota bacterium]
MSLVENFSDQYLSCNDCGCEFLFSVEDQEYYYEKRYSQPKRCPECRSQRRQDSRGQGNFGSQRKQLFNVTCDACGLETTVPFKPSGDRPVYCKDCYMNS